MCCSHTLPLCSIKRIVYIFIFRKMVKLFLFSWIFVTSTQMYICNLPCSRSVIWVCMFLEIPLDTELPVKRLILGEDSLSSRSHYLTAALHLRERPCETFRHPRCLSADVVIDEVFLKQPCWWDFKCATSLCYR